MLRSTWNVAELGDFEKFLPGELSWIAGGLLVAI
jgi:hypothetical protein